MVYFAVECECGAKLLRKSLARHRRTVHGGEKSHQCHLCAKTYTTKQNLNSHIAKHGVKGNNSQSTSSQAAIKDEDHLPKSKFHHYFGVTHT